MDDSTKIKITAIIGLVALEMVNLLTAKLDGNILMTISAIIGGIAGYEYGKVKGERKTPKPTPL